MQRITIELYVDDEIPSSVAEEAASDAIKSLRYSDFYEYGDIHVCYATVSQSTVEEVAS